MTLDTVTLDKLRAAEVDELVLAVRAGFTSGSLPDAYKALTELADRAAPAAAPTTPTLDVERLETWLRARGVTFHMADGSAYSPSMLDTLREYAALAATAPKEERP